MSGTASGRMSRRHSPHRHAKGRNYGRAPVGRTVRLLPFHRRTKTRRGGSLTGRASRVRSPSGMARASGRAAPARFLWNEPSLFPRCRHAATRRPAAQMGRPASVATTHRNGYADLQLGWDDLSPYSTVTDLARFLGWSTLQPRMTATSRAKSCSGTVAVMGLNSSRTRGM